MGNFDRTIFTTSILNTIGSWLPRGWVWRRSALGPLQTLLTVINMVAFGGKGFRAALRDVFGDMHRAFGWDGGAPTPSALTQARGKLTEKMCRDLFCRVSGEAKRVASRARLRYILMNKSAEIPVMISNSGRAVGTTVAWPGNRDGMAQPKHLLGSSRLVYCVSYPAAKVPAPSVMCKAPERWISTATPSEGRRRR